VQQALTRRVLRLSAAAIQAPPWLAARIRASLEDETVRLHRQRRRRFFASSGSVALAAAALFMFLGTPNTSRQVASPLARAAQAGLGSPVSIASSDTAILRAWLQHEVGYEVEIPAIGDADLVGASVTEMDGVRGAAVVYEYHGKPLTYFDLPSSGLADRWPQSDGVQTASADGYEVALWAQGDGARAVAAPMPRRAVVGVANECRRKAAGSDL
jgi:anti-sigma factor RsiW